MYLYNSATHKKEEFKTHTPNHVEMYTCGPTVYHFAHIGNLRSYIMEDVLEKYLRFSGYSVNRVMNITDVGHLTSDADEGEDKMVKGAKREHKTVMEIAKFYTDAFFADCKKLNIKRPDVVQPATGLIDDYIKIITKLLDTGYAYIAGGNVYFDTSKLERYYIFNDHNEEDLAVGVREGVEEDENKKNKNDFVLWFTKSKFEDQALKWDSPWGVGYPGWHIECSGISMKYNGEYLDLHCGGVDNAFPHHTNEIAQSESYLGHAWCPQWFHVHHLNTSTGKMSKSKGEFLTVSLLEEKGYEIVERNFKCRFGEIDIIASDRHYVVFVEVKLRASDRFVRAGAYVTPAKQARIRTAASLWLAEHDTPLQPRFDVIEIYGDADTPRRQRRINQIENAFE